MSENSTQSMKKHFETTLAREFSYDVTIPLKNLLIQLKHSYFDSTAFPSTMRGTDLRKWLIKNQYKKYITNNSFYNFMAVSPGELKLFTKIIKKLTQSGDIINRKTIEKEIKKHSEYGKQPLKRIVMKLSTVLIDSDVRTFGMYVVSKKTHKQIEKCLTAAMKELINNENKALNLRSLAREVRKTCPKLATYHISAIVAENPTPFRNLKK